MPAPEIIHQLVKRFEENLDSHHSSKYHKMQLRFVIEPSADRAIDKLVYELYGLTDEDVKEVVVL